MKVRFESRPENQQLKVMAFLTIKDREVVVGGKTEDEAIEDVKKTMIESLSWCRDISLHDDGTFTIGDKYNDE